MKKTVALIMAIFIITGAFAGCSGNSNGSDSFVALGLDTFDGTYSDYELWSNEMSNWHKEEDAPENITVTFNGVSYTGSYVHSEVLMFNNYMTHNYKTPEGVEFGINADTGAVVSYSSDLQSKPGGKTQEDCARIADEFIGQLVDVSQYTRTCTGDEAENGSFYHFSYMKYISGIETCDRLWIGLSGTGEILFFGSCMAGAIDLGSQDSRSELTKAVEELSSDKALAALSGKAATVFGGDEHYEISHRYIVILTDGSLAMLYTTYVETREPIGDGLWTGSTKTTQIIVKKE